jgi:hypothetical protein
VYPLTFGNNYLILTDSDLKAYLIYILYILGDDTVFVNYSEEFMEVGLYYLYVFYGRPVYIKLLLEDLIVIVTLDKPYILYLVYY